MILKVGEFSLFTLYAFVFQFFFFNKNIIKLSWNGLKVSPHILLISCTGKSSNYAVENPVIPWPGDGMSITDERGRPSCGSVCDILGKTQGRFCIIVWCPPEYNHKEASGKAKLRNIYKITGQRSSKMPVLQKKRKTEELLLIKILDERDMLIKCRE